MAVDPNIKFINIDLIKEVIGEVKKEEVYAKVKETKSRPKRASAWKAKANILKSMYIEVISLNWFGVDSSN